MKIHALSKTPTSRLWALLLVLPYIAVACCLSFALPFLLVLCLLVVFSCCCGLDKNGIGQADPLGIACPRPCCWLGAGRRGETIFETALQTTNSKRQSGFGGGERGEIKQAVDSVRCCQQFFLPPFSVENLLYGQALCRYNIYLTKFRIQKTEYRIGKP